MDHARHGLHDTQFDGSVLGPRIKCWAELPGEGSVHDKWLADPRTVTFDWFDMLRVYLRPFQQLLEAADYKVDLRYINPPSKFLCANATLNNGKHFVDQILLANQEFNAKWRQARSASFPAFHQCDTPSDHFLAAPKSNEPDCSGAKDKSGKGRQNCDVPAKKPKPAPMISIMQNLCFLLLFLLCHQISKGSCPSSGLLSLAPNGCSNFGVIRVSSVSSVFIRRVVPVRH